MREIKIAENLSPSINSLGWTFFEREVIARDLPYVRHFRYMVDTSVNIDVEDWKNILVASASSRKNHLNNCYILDDGSLIYINFETDDMFGYVAASTQEALDSAHDLVVAKFPEAPKKEDNIVKIKFWSGGGAQGPSDINRRIQVPQWTEIEANYPPDVRKQLDDMMEDFKPSFGGQLILWEGEPGTGKTYSLRSLAYAWRDWASFHYISDPESFFGNPSYMFAVLMDSNDHIFDDDEDSPEQWNVLILEDVGELLSADAKERTGQAVARLLNVVDGLIGQGLKILILATTNEPVKKFHTAISRPGRCAVHIKYDEFTSAEADEWLIANDLPPQGKAYSLAELFGIKNGQIESPEVLVSKPMGFAA